MIDCSLKTYGCSHGRPSDALDTSEPRAESAGRPTTRFISGPTGKPGQCKAVAKSMVNITTHAIIRSYSSENGLVAAFIKQPVAVGVAGNNAVWKHYTGGVVASCDATGIAAHRNHAVLAGSTPNRSACATSGAPHGATKATSGSSARATTLPAGSWGSVSIYPFAVDTGNQTL